MPLPGNTCIFLCMEAASCPKAGLEAHVRVACRLVACHTARDRGMQETHFLDATNADAFFPKGKEASVGQCQIPKAEPCL